MEKPSRIDAHYNDKNIECEEQVDGFQHFDYAGCRASIKVVDVQHNPIHRLGARLCSCGIVQKVAQVFEIVTDGGDQAQMFPIISGFGSSQDELGQVSPIVDFLYLRLNFAYARVCSTDLFGGACLFGL